MAKVSPPTNYIDILQNYSSKKQIEKLNWSFNETSRRIREHFITVHGLKIIFTSWNQLLVYSKIAKLLQQDSLAPKAMQSGYFASEESRIIYALLHLDGEARARELEITEDLFSDKDKARAWKKKLSNLIHPDRSKHHLAEEAQQKLNVLYERITG